MRQNGIYLGLLTTVTAVYLMFNACVPANAKAIWDEILKCAKNDELGKNALFYFGPSNVNGPGTIFQHFADGATQVSHLFSEYGTASVIGPSQPFPCNVSDVANFDLNGSASLPDGMPFTGKLAANFGRARNISVAAKKVEWVALVTGPYRTLVNGLPPDGPIRQDLDSGQLVLSRALRVSGMKAVLTFDSAAGADVQVEVPEGTVAGAASAATSALKKGTAAATKGTAANKSTAAGTKATTASQKGTAGGKKGTTPTSNPAADDDCPSIVASAAPETSSSSSSSSSSGSTDSKGIGISLVVKWHDTTQMTVCVASDFYIAGELRKYTQNGLSKQPTDVGPLQLGVDKWKYQVR
jgi:hypothetical protein